MRILLIEDDRALCTALLPALQAAGYTVDTCHDGADGKTLLCGGAYDVLCTGPDAARAGRS